VNARRLFLVLILLAGVCLFAYKSLARKPLKGSAAEIRARVLEKTPLGSTRKQVMGTIEREHWSCHRWFVGDGDGSREWGHHRHFKCCAEVGSYHEFFPPFFIFPCRAFACWLFGPDDRLTQVLASSACDGL
jgi:hypothetical protein